MKFRYFGDLFESFKDIFQKPILLLPQIYIFLAGILFLLLQVSTSGILNPNVWQILTVLVSLILYLLLSLAFYSANLATFRMFIAKKKFTPKTQLIEGTEIMWKVLGISIIKLLIVLVPLIILIFIGQLSQPVGSGALSVVTIILLIIFLIYAIIIGLYLFYTDVIIADKKARINESIKKSFQKFKDNKKHVIKIVLTLILVSIVYMLIVYAITGLIFGFSVRNPSETVVLLNSALNSLLSLPLYSAVLLYMFKSYKAIKA